MAGKTLKPGPVVKTHYELLEVHPRASQEVIQAAHRALIRRHHPDSGGDPAMAKALNEAYSVLSDADRRSRYDREQGGLEGKIIGQFRVLAEIAEGGFGTTYKGEHVIVGEPVCIKHCSRISPEDEAVLVNEARAMWDLRHFGIPAVRNLLKLEDGSLALVMSYIPGPTLAQIVEKRGRLDPVHVAWITQRVLNALAYLHDNGIVHGDIKPQNIIVQPEQHTAALVDFGLAAIKPVETTSSKGYTDIFAPPEQVNGNPPLPESDFYSLGMTMLYALSGSLDRAKRKQVPNDVPEPLCDFVNRLIVRDVLERPRWENENLYETLQQVRLKSFGSTSSNMKPLVV